MSTSVSVTLQFPSIQRTEDILNFLFSLDYFVPDEKREMAIPAVRLHGTGKLVVAVGDNASGKSFFRRLVSETCRNSTPKIECIHLSMEGRHSSGPMGAFIYGDENWESTGENSANTVLTAVRTSKNRTTPHVIFWDEPDLGLSDGWSASMGVEVRNFIEQAPDPLVTATRRSSACRASRS